MSAGKSAHDLARELQWIDQDGSQEGRVSPVTARRARREKIWIVTSCFWIDRRRAGSSQPASRQAGARGRGSRFDRGPPGNRFALHPMWRSACDFPGWSRSGLRSGGRERHSEAVAAAAGRERSSAAPGNGEFQIPLLVARQPIGRLLFGRETQEARGVGRSCRSRSATARGAVAEPGASMGPSCFRRNSGRDCFVCLRWRRTGTLTRVDERRTARIAGRSSCRMASTSSTWASVTIARRAENDAIYWASLDDTRTGC